MARKKRPILGKAWRLIALPMGKLGRTARAAFLVFITTNVKLLLLRERLRLRQRRRSYGYISSYDYQCFSPSSTPLFPWTRNSPDDGKRSRLLCLFCCGRVGGCSAPENNGELVGLEYGLSSEEIYDDAAVEAEDMEEWVDEEESVDWRAEKFIERFYEDMKLQRQRSAVRFMEMLHGSC